MSDDDNDGFRELSWWQWIFMLIYLGGALFWFTKAVAKYEVQKALQHDNVPRAVSTQQANQ